jgi:hypothetical protein
VAQDLEPRAKESNLDLPHIFEKMSGNIYAGLHEFGDMAFVLHFLRAGDLFADVGANIGSYTVLASMTYSIFRTNR